VRRPRKVINVLTSLTQEQFLERMNPLAESLLAIINARMNSQAEKDGDAYDDEQAAHVSIAALIEIVATITAETSDPALTMGAAINHLQGSVSKIKGEEVVPLCPCAKCTAERLLEMEAPATEH